MKLVNLLESKELITELRWYIEYIDEHSLDVQIEIKNDKLCFYHNGIVIARFNVDSANKFRTNILSDASSCYAYSRATSNKNRRILVEPVIATDGYYSYIYAGLIKQRFELGEPEIAKDPDWSRLYAINNKVRFILGEPTIATDLFSSYDYAINMIGGRFELGEPIIATDSFTAYSYAVNVLKTRFPLGEPVIAKDLNHWKEYQAFLNKLTNK